MTPLTGKLRESILAHFTEWPEDETRALDRVAGRLFDVADAADRRCDDNLMGEIVLAEQALVDALAALRAALDAEGLL